VLLPRLRTFSAQLVSPPEPYTSASAFFSSTLDRLQTQPSSDAPPTDPGVKAITYDEMVASLLRQVGQKAKEKAGNGSDNTEKLEKELKQGVDYHITQLEQVQKTKREELATEEKEQKKHITSEDMHEGWESKVRIFLLSRMIVVILLTYDLISSVVHTSQTRS
jgi:cell division cycle protein 37